MKRGTLCAPFDLILQWLGVAFVLGGQVLNTIGGTHPNWSLPWNIIVFTMGTIVWLIWATRVKLTSQIVLNIVVLFVNVIGIIKG